MGNKRSIRVMACGTFDQLHPGHIAYLKQAYQLGSELWVVVARDFRVKKIKGKSSRQNEEERLKEIQKKCRDWVNQAILGDEKDIYRSVDKIKPDVLAIGYDQKVNEVEIKKRFPDLKLVRLKPFAPDKYKSSLMKKPERES